MGERNKYKCRKCGHEFETSTGAGIKCTLYRCVDCDETKAVAHDLDAKKKVIGKCGACGGKVDADIAPMCRKCKSRDVEQGEMTVLWD